MSVALEHAIGTNFALIYDINMDLIYMSNGQSLSKTISGLKYTTKETGADDELTVTFVTNYWSIADTMAIQQYNAIYVRFGFIGGKVSKPIKMLIVKDRSKYGPKHVTHSIICKDWWSQQKQYPGGEQDNKQSIKDYFDRVSIGIAVILDPKPIEEIKLFQAFNPDTYKAKRDDTKTDPLKALMIPRKWADYIIKLEPTLTPHANIQKNLKYADSEEPIYVNGHEDTVSISKFPDWLQDGKRTYNISQTQNIISFSPAVTNKKKKKETAALYANIDPQTGDTVYGETFSKEVDTETIVEDVSKNYQENVKKQQQATISGYASMKPQDAEYDATVNAEVLEEFKSSGEASKYYGKLSMHPQTDEEIRIIRNFLDHIGAIGLMKQLDKRNSSGDVRYWVGLTYDEIKPFIKPSERLPEYSALPISSREGTDPYMPGSSNTYPIKTDDGISKSADDYHNVIKKTYNFESNAQWFSTAPILAMALKAMVRTEMAKNRYKKSEAILKLVGDPDLKSGQLIRIYGAANRHNTLYAIKECTHNLTLSGGYVTQIKMVAKRNPLLIEDLIGVKALDDSRPVNDLELNHVRSVMGKYLGDYKRSKQSIITPPEVLNFNDKVGLAKEFGGQVQAHVWKAEQISKENIKDANQD